MKIKSSLDKFGLNALNSLFLVVFVLSSLAACTSKTSEEYLMQAQQDIDRKEFQAAIINIKNALQQDSKNPQARYLLGKTYIEVRDGASAEKELEAARRLGLSSDLIMIPLGKAYLLQGKSKKLLEELKIESGFSKQIRSEIFVLKAQAHLELGETGNARNLLKSAFQEEPESLSAQLLNVRIAIIQRDLKLSQQLVSQVIQNQPANLEAWLLASEIARLNGDLISANKNYEKALTIEPTNIQALLGKAEVSIVTGDFQAALQSAEEIQRHSPRHPLANYVRAVVLYKQKDIEGAEEALQKVLKEASGHMPSLQMLGAIYFANGRYEQARITLERVVNAFPNNLNALRLLGATWSKLGKPDSAIQVLETALSVNETDPQLLAQLGSAYMQRNDTAKGTEYLERAVLQSPGNASIQTQLALGHLAAGKVAEATETLEGVVELGQDVFQAEILLVLTHIKSKEFKKALENTQRLAKTLPDSAVPKNLEGAAYIGLGDTQAARKSFEKALKIQSDFIPAIMNLAQLDEQEGDLKSAKSRLERAAKQHKGNYKILITLAKIEERIGNRERAEEWLNQAWEQNIGDLQVGAILVKYWMGRREFTKAIDIAEVVKKEHPKDFTVLKTYGLLELATGQQSAALETFKSLTELNPDVAAAHHLLGNAYISAGDFKTAKRHLNKALSLDANYIPAQLNLAQLAVKEGELEKAMHIARKIQKQNSSLNAGYQLEGDIHMHTKDHAAAVQTYAKGYAAAPSGVLAVKHYHAEKQYRPKKPNTTLLIGWLEKHPNDVRVRLVLAQAYTEAGNKQNAIVQYKRLLELSSNNVTALNNLAWLYYELDRKEDALGYGQKATDLAPSNPAVNDTYGWLLIQSGKSKQGLQYLKKAFQKAPDVAEIQYHYAVALERNGQTKRAREELEKLLTKHSDFPDAAKAKAMLTNMQ